MININLIAERRARQVREAMYLRFAALGVVALLVLMVTLNFAAYYEGVGMKKDIARVTDDLTLLKAEQEKLNDIIAEIDQYKPLVTLLGHVRMSESVWMTIIADMSRIIPDNVVLSGINTSANKEGIALRLGGMAKDQDTVGKFMVDLVEKTKWADKPIPGTLTQVDEDQFSSVRFDLTVPVRELLGGDL